MLIQGLKPSIPKTKPSLRDLIMKELEQSQPSLPSPIEDVPKSGVFMKFYLGIQSFLARIPFFRR